ncbi:MAG TPA: hypothetical protein VMI53_00490 [Opitutaceae bacterium]|nr:hypothetical protein [Opitutaceae bacterium]
MDDIQFVLGTFLRSESEQTKARFVEDYLSKRYEAKWVRVVSLSLRAAYNWIARNWEFLGEVGLRKSDEGEVRIVNCVLFALYNEIFKNPDPEHWQAVPSVDPKSIIHEAQKFIDAEKKREP